MSCRILLDSGRKKNNNKRPLPVSMVISVASKQHWLGFDDPLWQCNTQLQVPRFDRICLFLHLPYKCRLSFLLVYWKLHPFISSLASHCLSKAVKKKLQTTRLCNCSCIPLCDAVNTLQSLLYCMSSICVVLPSERTGIGAGEKSVWQSAGCSHIFSVLELITLILRSFTADEKAWVNTSQCDKSSFSLAL